MPLNAPALVTSKFVESITNGEEPPPKVIVPVLVPVLRPMVLVPLLVIETAPVRVKPPVPCSKPEPALTPTAVTAPALETWN